LIEAGIRSGPCRLRHFILLVTADYPGQCEVGCTVTGGYEGCRRCGIRAKLSGTTCRYPYWKEQQVKAFDDKEYTDFVPLASDIANEHRISERRELARLHGITGKSQLHRLHMLYEFDPFKDLTVDVQHTWSLRVIGLQMERLMRVDENGKKSNLDFELFQKRVKTVEWDTFHKAGRYPINFSENAISRWKGMCMKCVLLQRRRCRSLGSH
jgi:hypothetical protein